MQSKNNQSTIFTTSDLNTASVLLAFEVPLESINRSNPKKVSFTFGPRLMVNDLVQQYRKQWDLFDRSLAHASSLTPTTCTMLTSMALSLEKRT